jgi:hypothetical protein
MQSNLPYSHLSDLFISKEENITDGIISKVLAKLLTNDLFLSPTNSEFPSVWECKWFNNSNVPGYSKGDAVWYNTEILDEFIVKNSSKIYDYAKNNIYLKSKIVPFVANNAEILKLYEKIVVGYNEDGVVLPALFDLGNLSDEAQIKISNHDGNKDSLDVLSSWDDFFNKNLLNLMSASISGIVADAFKTHVLSYHLSSLSTEAEVQAEASKFLDHSLSNASAVQSESPLYITDQTGFDYVKKFSRNKSKWYRLWNSGLLEHGGIISATWTSGSVEVKLNWTDSNNETAPVFIYTESPASFYGMYSDFDDGSKISSANALNQNLRYVLEITPLLSASAVPYGMPDQFNNYTAAEACYLTNSSFSIKLTKNSTRVFSYYVRGFSSSK